MNNPHNYELEANGWIYCQCGKATNPAYIEVPNLPCWNCGQPIRKINPTPASNAEGNTSVSGPFPPAGQPQQERRLRRVGVQTPPAANASERDPDAVGDDTPRTKRGSWYATSDNGRRCLVVNVGLCQSIEQELIISQRELAEARDRLAAQEPIINKAAEAMGAIRLMAGFFGLDGPEWSEEPGFSGRVNDAFMDAISKSEAQAEEMERLRSVIRSIPNHTTEMGGSFTQWHKEICDICHEALAAHNP